MWVQLDREGNKEPLLGITDAQQLTTLRSIHAKASATRIREILTGECNSVFNVIVHPLKIDLIGVTQDNPFLLKARVSDKHDNESITMFIYLHPLTDEITAMHPSIDIDIPPEQRLEELQRYNQLFRTIRQLVEFEPIG